MIRSKASSNASNRTRGHTAFRLAAISAAVMSAFAIPNAAFAFEIDVGNPDLAMRWDNTFRYNLGMRTGSQNPALLKAVNNNDGDLNFSKNSLVANRLDVLSEFDIVWARSFGGRVSLAGWYDNAYSSLDNPSATTSNTLSNGSSGLPVTGLSDYTKRFAKGASGEVLDAFAFANFDLGKMPINIKVGQTTVFWGDSLLGNGAVHSVSYSQVPIDQWKAVATPGAEAKELFRPRQGITLQMQPTNDLSIAGQYFWAWAPYRYAESGSYLTFQDALQFGGGSFISGPNPFAAAFPGSPALQRLWRGTDRLPENNGGDFGVSARWSPDWLDGTLGFYYRRSADMQPQVVVTPGIVGLSALFPAAKCTAVGGVVALNAVCIINPAATNVADLTQKGRAGNYNLAYATGMNIYGVSLSKNLGGISFGSEISYREGMSLLSDGVTVLPYPLANFAAGQVAVQCSTPLPGIPIPANCVTAPDHGNPGALGNTWHGLVNALGVLPKTALFDTLSYGAELTWMMWDKVTQNEAVFKGRNTGPINPATGQPSYAAYTQIDRVSKSYFGLAINLTPTWFQVYPGVDLLAPISWSQGLAGNSAVTGGGQDGTGSWSVGLAADIYSRYRVDLKYVGFFGNYSTNPATGAMTVNNGVLAQLVDRGFVNLTFKTTF